ncbi:type I restriction enzyme, S subunit [Enterococcus sp. DIV0176]|uniref:restriction endonuclease subunit S n=1 Tax=Enterococcus sp. DIV0176 TaxID=2774758 RepID=UPI003D2FDFF1
MKDERKNAPVIRFDGFFDAWELRKLTDIVTRVNKSSSDNELPKVEFEDIFAGEGRLNKDVSTKFDNRKGIKFESEDVLYGKLRPYLKNWLLADFIGVALGDFWVFRAKESIPSFIYALIQADKYQKVANDTAGTKMPRSDWKKVSNTDFLIPKSIEEQQKIGVFFKQLDDTITLHQCKIDALKRMKKGFLQQMFPTNEESVPRVRFADFEEKWEQRKLSELAESFEYGLNATSTDYNGENKYLRITDIDDNSREFIQDGLTSPDIDLTSADNYKLQKGDVLFARTGASVGKTYRYQEKDGLVYYAGFLIRARIKPEFDSDFVFQNTLTDRYNNFIRITSQRSGQPGVNAKEYGDFQISVPNFDEQKKIGKFFKSIDDLFTLHQDQLNKLKILKKAYLQNMFI